MDEAEATQGNDAPESAPPALAQEAQAPVWDWSHLRGFQTVLEPGAETPERPDSYADELAKELSARVARFVQSVDDSIVLASDGVLRWLGDPVGRIVAGEDLLRPRVILLADDALGPEDRASVETRLSLWIAAHVRKVLGALEALKEASDLAEPARDIARAIVQALGVLERERVRNQVKALDQTARAGLRKLGVRFGSLYLYMPNLLKPAARALCSQLWALRRGPEPGAENLLAYASAGRTSFANEGFLSPDTYRVAGFRLCGERVVRVDIIERLSDLIRAAIPDHMRSGSRAPSDAYGFVVTPQMTSLTGCAGEPFASILRSLGFESHRVKRSEFEAANRKAPTEPLRTAPAAAGDAAAPIAEAEADASAHAEAAEPSAEDAASNDAQPETMAELDSSLNPPAAEGAEAPAASDLEAATAPAASPDEDTGVEAAAAPADLELAQPAGEASAESADAPAEPETGEAPAEPIAEIAPEPAEAFAEAAPEPAPAVAAVDDEEIDIWRPAPRRPRPAPRPPRAAEQREPGRPAGRRGDSRRQGRDSAPPPGDAPTAAEAAPVEAAPAAAPEPPRRDGRRDRNEPRHGDRPPRREEGRQPDPKRSGKEPPRREPRPTPVDPDSPFAKLLALKPLLERRDKRP